MDAAKAINYADDIATVLATVGWLTPIPGDEIVGTAAKGATTAAKFLMKLFKLAPEVADAAGVLTTKGTINALKVAKLTKDSKNTAAVIEMAKPMIEKAATEAGHAGQIGDFVMGKITKPVTSVTSEAATGVPPIAQLMDSVAPVGEEVAVAATTVNPRVAKIVKQMVQNMGAEDASKVMAQSGAKGFKITKAMTPEVQKTAIESMVPHLDEDKLIGNLTRRQGRISKKMNLQGAKLEDATTTRDELQKQVDSTKSGPIGKVMHGLGYATTLAMLAQMAGGLFGGSEQPSPEQLQAMMGLGNHGDELKEENMRLKNMMLMAKLAEQAEKNNNDLGGSLPRLF